MFFPGLFTHQLFYFLSYSSPNSSSIIIFIILLPQNFNTGVNDPPPGTDEVVAMTQIVKFLEEGIVLPNGDQMVSIIFFNHVYHCTVRHIFLHYFIYYLLRSLGYSATCLLVLIDHFREQNALELNQTFKNSTHFILSKHHLTVLTVSYTYT